MQGIFRLTIGLAFFAFSTGTFAAQNFFTNTNTPDTRSTAPRASAITRNPVMTPEQFKAGINRVNDQTQKNISEQLNKQLIKPQTAQPVVAAPPPPPDAESYSIENPPAGTTPATQTQQPFGIQQPPAQAGQRQPGMTPPPPSAPGGQPATTAPAPGTYYPSFNPGTNKSGSTPAGTSGGNQGQGGWNIKY
jgi:hypothetical protein